jgi:protein Tex
MTDLRPDMVPQGVFTNAAAFVGIVVHQDGLVHIAALSTPFVTDPHTAVMSLLPGSMLICCGFEQPGR